MTNPFNNTIPGLTPTEQMILEGQAPDTVDIYVNVYLTYMGVDKRPKLTMCAHSTEESALFSAKFVNKKKVVTAAHRVEVPLVELR